MSVLFLDEGSRSPVIHLVWEIFSQPVYKYDYIDYPKIIMLQWKRKPELSFGWCLVMCSMLLVGRTSGFIMAMEV